MPTLQDMADLLDEHGVPFEWSTDSELEARYPKIGDASKEMLMFMLRSHTYGSKRGRPCAELQAGRLL